MSESTTWSAKAIPAPKYVGGYRMGNEIPGIRFNMTRRPSAWHRFWMRVLLDWWWEDGDPLEWSQTMPAAPSVSEGTPDR